METQIQSDCGRDRVVFPDFQNQAHWRNSGPTEDDQEDTPYIVRAVGEVEACADESMHRGTNGGRMEIVSAGLYLRSWCSWK